MGRAAIVKTTRILILRGAKRNDERLLSKISEADGEIINNYDRNNKARSEDVKDSSCWVPHPKSGIYFPRGHEWVMNDVPDGAASFGRTYWLRSVDGVEKPNPDDDHHHHHHYFHANM